MIFYVSIFIIKKQDDLTEINLIYTNRLSCYNMNLEVLFFVILDNGYRRKSKDWSRVVIT